MTSNPIWPAEFPTGRQPSEPEMQPIKARDAEALRDYCLADVDYSQVESRVLVLTGGRCHGKTAAIQELMRQMGDQVKLAFRVPTDMLGEDRGPLTSEEFRAIMERQPAWEESKPKPAGKNPFAQGSIRKHDHGADRATTSKHRLRP